MQVFKLFFKIIDSRKFQIAIYIAVYLVLILGVIVPNMSKSSPSTYMQQRCKFAVDDRDDSVLSRGLIANLEGSHQRVTIKDFSRETLQDQHYNDEIEAAVVILPGFEKAFTQGNGSEYLLIYDIPGENTAKLFNADINEFLRYVETCKNVGYTMDAAIEEAGRIDDIGAEVELVGSAVSGGETRMTTFFKFMSWVFVLMIVSELSPILVALDRKEIKERMECSSFPFSGFNGQILLGSALMGLMVVVIFSVSAFISFPGEFTGVRAALMILNLICYMLVSLAIMFLISKLTSSDSTISLMANVISLGMSFLCGVFVSFYLLGDAVKTAAHFLPAYWYTDAVTRISEYSGGSLTEILQCMGTQVLFAGVILAAGILVARNKRVA